MSDIGEEVASFGRLGGGTELVAVDGGVVLGFLGTVDFAGEGFTEGLEDF